MPVSSQAPSHLLHPDAYSGHPDEMGRDPVCITGNVTAQQDLPALQLPDQGTRKGLGIHLELSACFSPAKTFCLRFSSSNHWQWLLAVQWLGLCASTAGGTGSVPGQGTKIPKATLPHGEVKIKPKQKK